MNSTELEYKKLRTNNGIEGSHMSSAQFAILANATADQARKLREKYFDSMPSIAGLFVNRR